VVVINLLFDASDDLVNEWLVVLSADREKA